MKENVTAARAIPEQHDYHFDEKELINLLSQAIVNQKGKLPSGRPSLSLSNYMINSPPSATLRFGDVYHWTPASQDS